MAQVSLGQGSNVAIDNHGIWQNTGGNGVWLDESLQVKVGQQTGGLTGMREMDWGFAECER